MKVMIAMEEQSKNDDLINVIISEINDCREDERNARNMIFQVISTAGGIIGILTGASFISTEMIELKRGLFILSGLVLCVGYAYTFSLGITNSLRFHYLRGLEDRLSSLLPTQTQNDNFINWTSFSSPILTLNPKHIKQSFYTYAHYFSFSLATFFVIIFGLGMEAVLYVNIEEHNVLDVICATLFAVIMSFAVVVYILACSKAKDMYDYAFNTSVLQRKQRMRNIQQQLSTEAKNVHTRKFLTQLKVIGYYIYPRIVDFQKPFLILLGFLVGCFFRNGAIITPTRDQLWHLFLVWFVVDFLVYQARYLWNDLYGMEGDITAEKKDRLPVHLIGEKNAILVALIVMILRLVLALVLIAFLPKGLRGSIFIISLMVFVIAFVYEYVSEHNKSNGVYFMVSFGYPLRLITGILAAWPQFGVTALNFGGSVVQISALIPTFIAFGLLGSYSSVLSWTHKAIDQKKQSKKVHKGYYEPLIAKIGDNVSFEYPLKEKCRLSDQWCLIFTCGVVMLSLTPCIIAFGHKGFLGIVLSELLFVILSGYFSFAPIKKAQICGFVIGVVLLLKATLVSTMITWHTFYGLVCILQAFFALLYYFMRFMFTVDYSFLNTCKDVAIYLVKIILGKNTVDYYKKKYISSKK